MSSDLCPFHKFKNLFGIPKKGIHQYRFLNTAIVDYLLTIVVSCITAYFTDIPLVLSTIVWSIMGVISHVLFGVQTNTVKYLGLTC